MLRRALRLGIRVGLIGGVAAVVAKLRSTRRPDAAGPPPAAPTPPTTWPRLEPDPVAAEHAAAAPATTSLQPDPEAPAAAPVLRPDTTVRKVVTKRTPAKKGPAKRPAVARSLAPAGPPAAETAPAATAALDVAAKAARAGAAPVAGATWVEPTDGVCPTTHPVKAKLGSKIFHLPGMLNYDRTRPDRCYADAASAEAEGLRPAKR